MRRRYGWQWLWSRTIYLISCKISTSSHFSNDLGLDSLDTVEVVMAIEEVRLYMVWRENLRSDSRTGV